MRVQLGRPGDLDVPEEKALQMVEWDAPELPGLSGQVVQRWRGMATWAPPATVVLARHRRHDGRHWVVTNSRESPAGYVLEYDLGTVHVHAQPGTVRVVADGDDYATTEEQDELQDGRRALGWIEAAPLPMLDLLELRRVRATGQVVPVGGEADPLRPVSDAVVTLGWIEGFPIQPRQADHHPALWGLTPLRRITLTDVWCHTYVAGEAEDGVGLGCVVDRPLRGFVALRRDSRGRVSSDLLAAPPAFPRPAAVCRWLAAPLTWHRPPRTWALRATAGRARRLMRKPHRPPAAPTTLGWLRSEPRAGWSPLVLAEHPALGDQLVTRSELEAHDLGYRVIGVLGWSVDAHVDDPAIAQPEILWGSRFGHGRRTLPGLAR